MWLFPHLVRSCGDQYVFDTAVFKVRGQTEDAARVTNTQARARFHRPWIN